MMERNCDIVPTMIKKKLGRKMKYANDDERKEAKREQTKLCLRKLYQPKKDDVFQKKQITLYNYLIQQFEKLATNYRIDLIEQLIKACHV